MANITKSNAKLTDSEKEFFRLILIRATSTNIGQPYIAPALFKLVPVSAPGLKTMAVDKFWRVYVDFEYMESKGVEFAAGVLAHEPWHLLRDHNARFENLDGDDNNNLAWNIAGDLEINDDIKKLIPSDSIFPGTGTFAKQREFDLAENYFAQVKDDKSIMDQFQAPKPECSCDDDKKKQPQQGGKDKDDQKQDGQDKGDDKGDQNKGDQDGGDQPGDKGEDGQDGQDGDQGDGDGNGADGQGDGDSDQDGEGNGQGNSQGQGQGGNQPGGKGGHSHDNTASDTCPVHGQNNGQGQGQGQPGQGQPGGQTINCGSGSGGEKIVEYELSEGEADAVNSVDHDTIKKQIAENIKNYERSNPGTVPGTIREWADNELAHKPINWRQALRGSFKQAIAWKKGQVDYVRTKPHRRQPVGWTIRPALRAPQPSVLVGIDTSGSNYGKLGIVVDEIENISRSVGIRGKELRAFGVDVQAGDVKPVNDPKKVLDGERLSGGTDMRVFYQVAAALKPKSDIAILLTDGETPWPTERPKGNNLRYITVLVVDKSLNWSQNIIDEANAALGSWGDVIVVDVNEEDL